MVSLEYLNIVVQEGVDGCGQKGKPEPVISLVNRHGGRIGGMIARGIEIKKLKS